MKRTLHAYQLHAHVQNAPLDDYRVFFEKIKKVRPSKRSHQIEDRHIFLAEISIHKDFILLAAEDGDAHTKPRLYNPQTNQERIGDKGDDELLSTRTHAAFDLRTRFVTVEFNQRGAKATQILGILREIGSRLQGYAGLSLEMPPVANEEFLRELHKFNRIRVATVQMVEPNVDWEDCADKLSGMAKESEAKKIEVTFTASRDGSIAKEYGLLGSIQNLIRRGKHIFNNVVVRGSRTDSKQEAMLKLHNHTEQKKVEVAKSLVDGYPEPKAVQQALLQFLEQLAEGHPAADVENDDS